MSSVSMEPWIHVKLNHPEVQAEGYLGTQGDRGSSSYCSGSSSSGPRQEVALDFPEHPTQTWE